MEQKVKDLAETIYREGVEKGETQAGEIVKEAENRAAQIEKEARARAESIVEDAKKEAQQIKHNMESELKLASTQALSSIKQQIMDLIEAKALDEPVEKTLADPEVVRELIKTVAQNWKEGGDDTPDLVVMLPEGKRSELEKALKGGILDILSKGQQLQFSKKIKAGFTIGPADGGYKISLTDEDFGEFFKEFLRPHTRTFLFGE